MKKADYFSGICCGGFLIAMTFCGCSKQSGPSSVTTDKGASNSSKVSVPTLAASPSGDARTEVLKAFQTLLASPSYSMHTVGTDSEGRNSTVTMEYAAPDHYHITREGDPTPGTGTTKTDMIGIGDETWFKMGDQPWKKSPVRLSAMKEMQKSWLDKINDKNSDVKLLRTEPLDGTPMNVYQISYNMKDADLETTYKGTGTIWVGATDHLLHKSEIESQSSDDTHPSKMTTTYDANPNVKIEPPM